MCGIVGYSGSKNAIRIVLDGLAYLEYRGYDSSGVSYLNGDGIQTKKEKGRLNILEDKINFDQEQARLAIGHTRWATHGVVNTFNAHPHVTEDIAIVHNGIVENAQELKIDLIEKGETFKSQTDSEVFLKLIESYLKNKKEISKAICLAFQKVKGNSAFVVLSKNDQKLYGIKRNAPLVCGINQQDSSLFISSDPYSLVGLVDTLFFPEDSILCFGNYQTKTGYSFQELDGTPSKRYTVQENQLKAQKQDKGRFKHFMLKEIFEQPSLIKNLYQVYSSSQEQEKIQNLLKQSIDYITIVACGTAYYAGLIIQNYLKKYTSIKVSVNYASEFRYTHYKPSKSEIGLLISQSGETADTLACRDLFEQHQVLHYAILNVEGSTLSRYSDGCLFIHGGFEIGVASTKAFTLQVLTGLIMTSVLEQGKVKPELEQEFSILASKINELLQNHSHIQKVAQEIVNYRGFIFTGRQSHYPIALEGALKMKEITYIQSQGYAAGELKHGPISLIDQEMVNVALLTPDLFDKTLSNLQEVHARGGKIVVIGQVNNAEVSEIADFCIHLNYEGLDDTAPLLSNVVLQLLSYYVGRQKGTDIDKPRNLAKSVTVE